MAKIDQPISRPISLPISLALDSPLVGKWGGGFSPLSLSALTGYDRTPFVMPVRTVSSGWTGDRSTAGLMPDIEDGVTYWVDAITGNNVNAGTEALPFASISTALAKTDAGRIMVAPAPTDNPVIYRDFRFSSSSPATTKPGLIFQKWDLREGVVRSTTCYDHRTLTSWVQDGTYTNTWAITRSAVAQVIDLDETEASGSHYRYTLAASLEACNDTEGSYFISGTTLSVHALGSGEPQKNVLIFLGETNCLINSRKTFYFDEGFEFWGGNRPIWLRNNSGTEEGRIIFKGSKFRYASDATNGNGVDVDGYFELLFDECEADYNKLDGFNYHADTATVPMAIELNCKGRRNGNGAGTNNGSTGHDASYIARYGGEYTYNDGPNVAETGGCFSWGVGVKAGYSTRAAGITKADFYNSGGKTWLYECEALSAEGADTSPYSSTVTSDGVTYLDGFVSTGTVEDSGTGTHEDYVQT